MVVVAIDKEMYQRLVEKYNYLSHTRPDIAFFSEFSKSVYA